MDGKSKKLQKSTAVCASDHSGADLDCTDLYTCCNSTET